MFLKLSSSAGPSILLLGQDELLVGNGMCLETGDSKRWQTRVYVSWYHVEERGQVHVGFPAVGVSRGGPEDGLGALTVPLPPSYISISSLPFFFLLFFPVS